MPIAACMTAGLDVRVTISYFPPWMKRDIRHHDTLLSLHTVQGLIQTLHNQHIVVPTLILRTIIIKTHIDLY
ncbi:MAG: hypothetical protein NPIRA02_25280 [Nitrospirales bacterium]|nr:MAG: hypothetical protein NPIRA02_25280 [Nitrospirales bacterium]